MKKNYTFFLVFFIGSLSFGQATLTMSDAPANGENLIVDPETGSSGNATIDFQTTNFIMCADATGTTPSGCDGFIKWTLVNTGSATETDSGSIFTSNNPLITYIVNGITQGQSYVFRAELVDNAGAPLSSPVVYSFTFTVATYSQSATIAGLRSSMVGPDNYYEVVGEVTNTFTITGFGPPTMFFQDFSGGIMVYDNNYALTTYSIGDKVSNIKGHLEMVDGMLLLIPSDADWGAPNSSGNAIPNVATVTIANLSSIDYEAYESRLVNINGVTFADAGSTFSDFGSYNITDATGTMTFSVSFPNANYIGQTIPSGNQNLTVIVSEINGVPQVTSRSLADITLSAKSFEVDSFKMYPNPTSLGYVNISSNNSSRINVAVFDILGKQIIKETLNNNKLNVSNLKTGIYVMKITQEDASITKKLVIK